LHRVRRSPSVATHEAVLGDGRCPGPVSVNHAISIVKSAATVRAISPEAEACAVDVSIVVVVKRVHIIVPVRAVAETVVPLPYRMYVGSICGSSSEAGNGYCGNGCNQPDAATPSMVWTLQEVPSLVCRPSVRIICRVSRLLSSVSPRLDRCRLGRLDGMKPAGCQKGSCSLQASNRTLFGGTPPVRANVSRYRGLRAAPPLLRSCRRQ
jgi:hypothetical protein